MRVFSTWKKIKKEIMETSLKRQNLQRSRNKIEDVMEK